MKHSILAVFALLATVALLVTGCGPAAEQPAAEASSQAEDIAAIKALIGETVATYNTGDAAAVIALFTDDAILMPPNQPAVIGREANKSRFQAYFDQFTAKLTLEAVEVEVAGDWAFSRGSSATTVTPKAGGEPTEEINKSLAISKRQPDGSWKIYRHIWNSDNPLLGTE